VINLSENTAQKIACNLISHRESLRKKIILPQSQCPRCKQKNKRSILQEFADRKSFGTFYHPYLEGYTCDFCDIFNPTWPAFHCPTCSFDICKYDLDHYDTTSPSFKNNFEHVQDERKNPKKPLLKNVRFVHGEKPWLAQKMHGGKVIIRKKYKTKDEAILALDRACFENDLVTENCECSAKMFENIGCNNPLSTIFVQCDKCGNWWHSECTSLNHVKVELAAPIGGDIGDFICMLCTKVDLSQSIGNKSAIQFPPPPKPPAPNQMNSNKDIVEEASVSSRESSPDLSQSRLGNRSLTPRPRSFSASGHPRIISPSVMKPEFSPSLSDLDKVQKESRVPIYARPEDVRKWTNDDVCSALRDWKVDEQVIQFFRNEQWEGSHFLTLERDDPDYEKIFPRVRDRLTVWSRVKKWKSRFPLI